MHSKHLHSKFYLHGLNMAKNSRHYQKGIKLFYDGNKAEAFKCFVKGATNGDCFAMAMYIVSLFTGQGVLPDKKKAKENFEDCLNDIIKEIEDGSIEALRLRAELSLLNPARFDEGNIYKCLQEAADGGDKYAMLRLAELYFQEDERSWDVEKGYKFACDAYENGVESAMVILAKYWGDKYERDKFDAMFEECKKANAVCKSFVGECYFDGKYVENDEKLAYKFLKKAADEGEIKSQILLAKALRDGIGTKKDVYAGVTLLQQVGEYCVEALSELGYWYENALGVARLINESLKYYKQASDLGDYYSKQKYEKLYTQTPKGKKAKELEALMENVKLGDVTAQHDLAVKYLEGDGVRKNLKKAIELFTLAAKQNHTNAICKLCDIYYRDEYGICDYKKAFNMCGALIDNEQYISQSNAIIVHGRIATMYRKGLGVQMDIDKAIEHYKRCVELGNFEGYYHLGKIFETNKYGRQMVDRAISLYQKGADKGDDACIAQLAYIYAEGSIVPANEKLAVEYALKSDALGSSSCHSLLAKAYWEARGGVDENWQKARKYAESGLKHFADDWWALGVLGDIYKSGCGVEQDEIKGFGYHLRAAKTGCVNAQYCVAVNYAYGNGVAKDLQEAVYWCQKAADAGHQKAKEFLKELYTMI